MKIGVIGSSHLGLVWTNVLAEKGFPVFSLGLELEWRQYENSKLSNNS